MTLALFLAILFVGILAGLPVAFSLLLSAMALVGHRRVGLGYVAILTAILLAGLSGSAVADAAALVSSLYPMMKQAG